MDRRIGFARWRSEVESGGNRYDDAVAVALRAHGLDVRECRITGAWPIPTQRDRDRFAALLSTARDWLIDNIVGSADPAALVAATDSGRRVTMLVHYFPSEDPALPGPARERLATTEARAMHAATTVVATSAWTADEIASRYGRDDVLVALPGVEPAEPAIGTLSSGGVPTLLWLARVTRTKDPLTFVEALIRLQDLEWTAQLVGPDTLDQDLDRELHERLAAARLSHRVRVTGPRHGEALESVWRGTDLLVHTARTEPYGMVISEALARGLPSIVPSGTGAVEAQRGVGETFTPGDPEALAAVLREWLTDPDLRQRWRVQAAGLRPYLATWADTGRLISSALSR